MELSLFSKEFKKTMSGKKKKIVKTGKFNKLFTHAIFSDGDLQGSSSSSSLSSLPSPSNPSSPEILNDDEVNISGTGKIEGLRLPVNCDIMRNGTVNNWVSKRIKFK